MKTRVILMIGSVLLPILMVATFVGFVNSLLAANTATFTVTTVADSDDFACDSSCSLREAIYAANDAAGYDTIDFALPDNSTITLEGTQLPTITDSLHIDGQTAVSLTISGDNASRIFEIDNGTAVTLTQLVISNGLVTATHPISDGGGIYVNYLSSLTLNDSVLSHNTANNNGGGLFNDEGSVTLNNTSFIQNSADNDGGGFYNYYGETTLDTVYFWGNNTVDDGGGFINNHGTATITNSTFISNSAGDKAGGVYNRSFDANTTIQHSIVISNTSEKGAGLRNWEGVLTVTHVTVIYNKALEEGGGVQSYIGTVYIDDSTIADNSAVDGGGGIYNDGESSDTPFPDNGTIYVQNSTISGNSTPNVGGGLNLEEGGFVLTNTTIYSNSAGQGGGMAIVSGTISMTNNLVGGSSLLGGDCVISGTVGINTNNLIEDNSCSPAVSGDANVLPLADYGGETWTHALLNNSPALDAGNNAVCPNQDQRGYMRPFDGDGDGTAVCDIGAYEAEFYWLYLPIIQKN